MVRSSNDNGRCEPEPPILVILVMKKKSALCFVTESFLALPDVRWSPPFHSFASVDEECGSPQGSFFDHGGLVILTKRGQDLESGVQVQRSATADLPLRIYLDRLPFAQRLTCTVAEACEATGLGRTKIYELIGDGLVSTTTVGRRRLVSVQSLLALVGVNAKPIDSG